MINEIIKNCQIGKQNVREGGASDVAREKNRRGLMNYVRGKYGKRREENSITLTNQSWK